MNPLLAHFVTGLSADGMVEWIKSKITDKETLQAAVKVVKDALEAGEAGGEAFTILLATFHSKKESDFIDTLFEWLEQKGPIGLLALQQALDNHYKDLRDGVTLQISKITEDDNGNKHQSANWPEGLRPEEMLVGSWEAILYREESHPGTIDKAIRFFCAGRETRLEKWWSAAQEWLETSPTWMRVKETAKRLSWAYLTTIAVLTVITLLFAGSTLHLALEGNKPGLTVVFLGITALLITVLYTIRYPLQEAWQITTDLFRGGDTNWAAQKRTITRRIGYLAATALVLVLVPMGQHPYLFSVSILGLVVAFMLREFPRWKLAGQVVTAVCILLVVLPSIFPSLQTTAEAATGAVDRGIAKVGNVMECLGNDAPECQERKEEAQAEPDSSNSDRPTITITEKAMRVPNPKGTRTRFKPLDGCVNAVYYYENELVQELTLCNRPGNVYIPRYDVAELAVVEPYELVRVVISTEKI